MKINGKLLALCVFHPNVWGTTAFLSWAPKPLTATGWLSKDVQSPVSSFFRPQSKDADFSGGVSEIYGPPVSSTSPAKFSSATMDQSTSQLASTSPAASVNQGESRLFSTSSTPSPADSLTTTKKTWDQSSPVLVQGGSLKTWTFSSHSVQRVKVVLKTEGRPLDADIDLWQGPDNTPHKMRVYIEDGSVRAFSAVVETPRDTNTIAIRNTAHLEFPLSAVVVADYAASASYVPLTVATASEMNDVPRIIQGGALRTYPFDASIQSVQILLKTDGRPLNARIELLQGPNNKKQVIDLYTEDGMDRPFFAVIDTPGSGNVVRVVNTATVEFPMTAWVEPYLVGTDASAMDPVLGGDDGTGGFMPVLDQW